MAEIPVSGTVLTWARKFRGLSLDEAADAIGMTSAELEELETEVRMPTLTKFEKIGATYQLPLATLFRRTPPKIPEEPHDFRTFEGAPDRRRRDLMEDAAHLMFEFMRRSIGVASGDFGLWLVWSFLVPAGWFGRVRSRLLGAGQFVPVGSYV